MDRQRTFEREWKLSEVENLSIIMNAAAATDANDERCESLPPHCAAVRVCESLGSLLSFFLNKNFFLNIRIERM